MGVSRQFIEDRERERATMVKKPEPVTYLHFDPDGHVVRERTETRMVYRYADGRIMINGNKIMRRVLEENGRLVAFGGQEMPIRVRVSQRWARRRTLWP